MYDNIPLAILEFALTTLDQHHKHHQPVTIGQCGCTQNPGGKKSFGGVTVSVTGGGYDSVGLFCRTNPYGNLATEFLAQYLPVALFELLLIENLDLGIFLGLAQTSLENG